VPSSTTRSGPNPVPVEPPALVVAAADRVLVDRDLGRVGPVVGARGVGVLADVPAIGLVGQEIERHPDIAGRLVGHCADVPGLALPAGGDDVVADGGVDDDRFVPVGRRHVREEVELRVLGGDDERPERLAERDLEADAVVERADPEVHGPARRRTDGPWATVLGASGATTLGGRKTSEVIALALYGQV